MSKFKIETNVPIPPEEEHQKYPFSEMKVGESIVFSIEQKYRLQSAASNHKKRNPDFNYMIRGFRMWRIMND